MTEKWPEERFPSSEELLSWLKERSDDFESVSMMVSNDVKLTGPRGQNRVVKNACAVVAKCNGQSFLVSRQDFEILLNDGILQRLKIPISLVPREAR